MELADMGYHHAFDKIKWTVPENFELGRVVAEHKERYVVATTKGEFEAEVTGNMRFTANSPEDFPVVGDWVSMMVYDSDSAIIHQILPRTTVIRRQAVGHTGKIQIIAANVDYAFIVQAVDRDFNINRLERYLIICNSAKVSSLIILTKTDLINEPQVQEILDNIRLRIKNVPVIPVSNETKSGYETVAKHIIKGNTYCLLGSSGVGKSTLINNLSGRAIMRTDNISQSTNKGRHTTSHRELIFLENGGILIDNPGMREVGIAATDGGFDTTFDMITRLSYQCRFKNCTHTNETGCAVIEAVNAGKLDKNAYDNYLKMEKEKSWFESTVAEKKRKEKILGKMIKNYIKTDPNKKV
jgi:ribosome biogenesis GTPase / thiamine phosphate phosphatase